MVQAEQWTRCPKCGSSIIYGDYEFEDTIWQKCHCGFCGFEWQMVYIFSHQETREAVLLDDNGNEIIEPKGTEDG